MFWCTNIQLVDIFFKISPFIIKIKSIWNDIDKKLNVFNFLILIVLSELSL